MQAKKPGITKKVAKTIASRFSFINIPAWIGTKQLRSFWSFISIMFKTLFIPKEPTGEEEDFQRAITRLGLTEVDLQQRAKEFKRLVIIFMLFTLLLLGYVGYLIWEESYKIATVVFCLDLIVLANAFRYHFWLFQLRQRKLGCSFAEWFYEGLLRIKK